MSVETKQEKKERRQTEAAAAWLEHLTQQKSVDDNMRRLREERLARHREVSRTLQAIRPH